MSASGGKENLLMQARAAGVLANTPSSPPVTAGIFRRADEVCSTLMLQEEVMMDAACLQ